MKPFKIGLVAVIVSTALLYGADSINAQIEAIQKASPQERVVLMNNLKLQLASMNEEARSKAIGTLQTKMGSLMGTTTSQMPMNSVQQMPMNNVQQMQQNIIMQRQMGNTNRPMMSPMGR